MRITNCCIKVIYYGSGEYLGFFSIFLRKES